jgi:uncharacterized membrane protein
LTGLAVVLPVVISLALVRWLFGIVSNITDILLIFLPKEAVYPMGGKDPYWYWSALALVLAIILLMLIGQLARHYVGVKIIQWVDLVLLRIPLLNKIYAAVKQVNEAFSSNKKTAFKQVVLVEFPRQGAYSIGFVTSEEHHEVSLKTGRQVVCVFVPTTPNPTSGYLVLLPKDDVVQLEMSVADGIKFIISLGAIAPDYAPQLGPAAAGGPQKCFAADLEKAQTS